VTRVLVTGAGGQLGSTVVARMSRRHEVIPFTRGQLDIADEAAVLDAVRGAAPAVIVNCAAYNDVDRAEDEAEAAMLGNAFGVLSLARAAAAAGALLVHYSTDFVFDGRATAPYEEGDAPKPLSTYGTSKLLGEWFADEAPSTYILRVESLFGGHPAKSSVDKILDAIVAGRPVRVFVDRTVTPSYVDDVSDATEALLARRAPFGVYHCVNSGVTTWTGIAEAAVRLLDRPAEIVPVEMGAVSMRAQRPLYCALSNRKLAAAGVSMPSWEEALTRYVRNGSF
jgi:dTDP-4-dehydrorhamnose reductase